MNKNLEVELLLSDISELYKANSNTNYNDIYNLINKNTKEINLINVQSNFYQNKKDYETNGIKIIPNKDYLEIYLPDKDKKIPSILENQNNIKIYLSLEQDEISEISSKIIEYMYKKRIPALYTIQNYYNEKVVWISFISTEDLEAVMSYIEKKIKINNISLGLDGIISYDIVLSKIIERYMKEIDSYDKVNINSFLNFIEDNILSLNKKKKEYLMMLYELDSYEKYTNFIVLSNIIKDNIYNELSLTKLQKYQKKICSKKENLFTDKQRVNINKLAVRELLDLMLEIYDNDLNVGNTVDELHKNILSFLKTQDYNYLPKEYCIQNLIKERITYDSFSNYIIELGKETLFKLCVDTKTKYGEEQLKIALSEAEETGNISSFTNENDNRSELGIILPKEILKEIVKDEYAKQIINC